ncbi:putative transferase [Helianthus anomalus]
MRNATLTKLFLSNIVHIGSSPRFDMYGCEFGLGKALAPRSGFVNKADMKMTLYPDRKAG